MSGLVTAGIGPSWQRQAVRRAKQHATALARPTVAIPYVGDPKLGAHVGEHHRSPVERFVILYAAALMKRRGALPEDASGFDAHLSGDQGVVFVRADGSQAEVCRIMVPREAQL